MSHVRHHVNVISHVNVTWDIIAYDISHVWHCNTLQHTATHCNTLQHTATHCNTLQNDISHVRWCWHGRCYIMRSCDINTWDDVYTRDIIAHDHVNIILHVNVTWADVSSDIYMWDSVYMMSNGWHLQIMCDDVTCHEVSWHVNIISHVNVTWATSRHVRCTCVRWKKCTYHGIMIMSRKVHDISEMMSHVTFTCEIVFTWCLHTRHHHTWHLTCEMMFTREMWRVHMSHLHVNIMSSHMSDDVASHMGHDMCVMSHMKEACHICRTGHCNTLQHDIARETSSHMTSHLCDTATHCNTLQHTATHCNTLQHTATHCNTPQHDIIAHDIAHSFV